MRDVIAEEGLPAHAGGVVIRFYPALMILVAVTVAGWGMGMYVHAFLLPK